MSKKHFLKEFIIINLFLLCALKGIRLAPEEEKKKRENRDWTPP